MNEAIIYLVEGYLWKKKKKKRPPGFGVSHLHIISIKFYLSISSTNNFGFSNFSKITLINSEFLYKFYTVSIFNKISFYSIFTTLTCIDSVSLSDSGSIFMVL